MSNIIVCLLAAIIGWCAINGFMQFVTRIAYSKFDDAAQIVRTLETQRGIWSLMDLALRTCWCALVGTMVVAGPAKYCGTRLVIVGWSVAIIGLIEAHWAPSGASAVYLIYLLWLAPISTFMGGLMRVREKLHWLQAIRSGSTQA